MHHNKINPPIIELGHERENCYVSSMSATSPKATGLLRYGKTLPADVTQRVQEQCLYSSRERRFRTIGPTTYHHSQTTPLPNKIRPIPKGW